MVLAVVVRQSGIDGRGVFAARHYSSGDVVLTIDDSYVVDNEHPVPRGEERHCDYLECGKTVWMQVPERHINHSCDPNVFVRTIDGIRHVLALRDIRTGEEITYDYCVNGYGDVVWHCSCGADRCRGTIHSDFFHLPLDLQWQYLPLLDEWFRKERSEDIEKLRAMPPPGHPVVDRRL
jgi:SET domain-containing protein